MFHYYQNLFLKARNLVPQKTLKKVFDETRILTENSDDSIKLCLACTLNLNKSEEKTFQLCI